MVVNFDDCWDSLERTHAELEQLESELASRFGVSPSRATLLELDDAGKLDDSPLVSDWRATYARLLSWWL